MTHSEPARAGADAYDNMVAWMSMNAPYHHMMAFKAALERPASPAPAAGVEAVAVPAGWKLVPVEPTRAMKDAVSRKVDDFTREHARLFVSEIWQDMLSASPAATSAPTYVVNCCNCGRIIDTREESKGGDQWGHQLSDNRWVCSPECLDAVADPDAVPAATRGDGEFTALRVAYKRGVAWAIENPGANSAWVEKAAYDYADKATSAPPPAPAVESAQVKEARRVRHKKRGGIYEVLGEAEVQISHGMKGDDPELFRHVFEGNFLTVYRSEQTGKLWCRFPDEFEDGRFEDIRASLDLATDAEG